MRPLNRFINRTLATLTGPCARRYLRITVSLFVSALLILQAFPLPGQPDYQRGSIVPPAGPIDIFVHPADTLNYAASLFTLYPEMALAQSDVITKTAPATAKPGDSVLYPIVLEKTDPTTWLTGTVLITDVAPVDTTYFSGAASSPWWHGNVGQEGLFRNLGGPLTGTGLITVGTFIVQVDPLVPNGTIITNTAYLSTPIGLAASPIVTTIIEAPEFSLAKYPSSSPVCAGSLLTYTTVVSNVGPDPFDSITTPYTEVDKLPSQVSLVYASNSPVTSADTITWTMTSPLDSLWGNGTTLVTRTAVVSVPYSLSNGVTLTNHLTVSHATVPTVSFVLPITVTKVTPDFISNSPVGFGAPAIFTNTTVGDATFDWDFGDGGTSTAISPTHVYTSDGVFTVTLTATSLHGCGVLTVTHPITVLLPASITVTANPTNTFANGISSTLVTAVVSDTFGSPVPGLPLTFTTSLGNWTGDGQTMVVNTDSVGVATNTLTSTVAGTAYITVTTPNGISDTTQVVFGRVVNLDTARWFVTIQNAVDAADTLNGHTLLATTGTYTENVVITKEITLTGEGPGNTIIYPALINPDCRFGGAGSICNGGSPQASNVILVEANNVTIYNLTVDGNNPALTSGVLSNGVDVEARNGILPNYLLGIFDNLEVYSTTIRNIYLRGLYAASGGTFNFHHNTVQNVQGEVQSIAIMNWNGVGTIAYNQVSDANDGIVANHSRGTQFLYNVVTNSSSGVHTDNAGDSGGSADLLEGNVVSNCQPNGYGVWTFVPRIAPTVRQNQVDNCAVGLAVSGASAITTATTLFVNNIVTGTAGSVGAYVTTDGFGWGPGSVTASFMGNTVTGNDTGFYLEQVGGLTYTLSTLIQSNTIQSNLVGGIEMTGTNSISVTALSNTIANNGGDGLLVSSAPVLTSAVHNNIICNNGSFEAENQAAPTLDAIGNWWGHNPPIVSGADYAGPITVNPPISFTLTAEPPVIMADGTSTSVITVAMSGGGYALPGPYTATISTDAGTLSPAQVVLTNGIADSTLTLTSTTYPVTATIVATVTVSPCGDEVATTTVRFDRPSLGLSKIDNPDPVQAGDTLTYTLVYTNQSGVPANNIWLVDTLPLSVTFSGSVPSPDDQSGNVISWNITSLPPYSTSQVMMTVTVGSPIISGTILTNTALITAPAVLTEATALVTTTIWSSHVLTITKSDNPDPVAAGTMLAYTLAYTVAGNEPAVNAVVTDAVPANTVFSSASGGVTPVGGVLTWNLGTLYPPDNGALTFTVQVASPLSDGTVLTNTAHFYDGNGGVPVTSTVTTTVVSSHTLHLVKSDAPDPVDAGTTLTYTLAYSVTGNEAAQTVTISDVVPVDTSYDSCMGGLSCNETGGVVTWTLGTLNPGDFGQLTMLVTVTTPLTNGTLLTNTGHIYDYNSGVPVLSTVTTTVSSRPNVTYTKVAEPFAGSTINLSLGSTSRITYTIIVTNSGNTDVTDLVVTDTIPANTNGSDLVWTDNFLAANGGVVSNTFVVTVNVPLADGTVITNEYQVGYAGQVFTATSPLSATNVVTHLVVSQPVVSVTKTSVPTPTTMVTPGQVIAYSFIITNSGPATATNFVLTDTVPADTTYVGGSASTGNTGIVSEVGGTITLTGTGLVTPNNVLTMSFQVTVNSPLPNGTVISNQGWYTYAEASALQPTNEVTHLVQSAVDITPTKTAVPAPGTSVSPGDRITYTITITNNGSADATNAVLTDTVPQYTQYAAGTATPGPISTDPLVWNLGAISGAGGVATATFVVQVDTPLTNALTISNSAQLDLAETVGLSTTNFVTHTVISTPSLTLNKLAVPPAGQTVVPGGIISYTITVTNSGNGPATSFRITDTVPVSTSLAGAVNTTPGFTPIIGTNVITVDGTLGAGQTMTVTFAVTISTAVTEGTVFTNTGYVSYAESSVISPTNAVTHVVLMTPVLTLTKLAEPAGPTIGPSDTITYTVVVFNNGFFDAHNVVLTDVVPAYTNYVSGSLTSTLGSTSDTGPLVVTVDPLPAGQVMTFTFQVTVTTPITGGTVISNLAQMTADYLSLVESNQVTHTVVATPDLVLEKLASPPSGADVDPGDVILYRILVTNNGGGNATNLFITDTVPISTEYVLSQLIPPFIGSETGPDPLVVTAPSLPGNGGQLEYRIVVTVTDTAPSGLVITNAAQVSSDQTVLTTTNVVSHQVGATPALTVTKTAVPASGAGVGPGAPITYTVTVTNTGFTTLTLVNLFDLLDSNTVWVSTTPTPPPLFLTESSALWASLGPNNSASLVIRVNVTSTIPAGTVITNTALAFGVGTDVVTTEPVTHVIVSPVLVITKTDNVTTVQPGDLLTYTLTISNEGNAVATGLVLTDAVPTGTTYVTGSASDGGVYSLATGEITWTISILTDSTTLTRTFAVVVDSPVPAGLESITNTVTVIDDGGGLATALDVDTVDAAPNLLIRKAPSGSTEPGAVITYTLTYTNAGNQTASGVVVSETVPLNTNFNAGVSSPGWSCADGAAAGTSCIFSGGVVTGGNTTASVTFAVTVTSPLSDGTIISNTAYVTHDDTTVITPSNTVTHVVQLRPDLTLSKLADPPSGSSVTPADPITYTIVVTNSGSGDATGVVITDALDPNVNLVDVLSSTGTISSTNPLVLSAGTVPANGGIVSYTVRVTVTTPLTNGTILLNQAQVTAVEMPTAVLSEQVTHTVVATPNLLIQKLSTTTSTVNAGGSINYAVRVINTGNGPATGVRITDTLPISTTFFSAQLLPPGVGTVPITDPVVADIPVLAGGGGMAELRFSVNIDADAPAGLVITNVAQVDSNETVVTNTNVVTHIIVAPQLALTKQADPAQGGLVNPGEMITYTLVVANVGSAVANNVVVTDTLDANVNFVDATPVQDSGPNPLVFDVGNLFGGQSVTYTVRVTVTNALAGGTVITNVAQIQSDDTAVFTTPPVTHQVAAVPVLNITKAAIPSSGTSVGPNTVITYTVVVVNNGNSAANNVLITDTLPVTGVNVITAYLSSGDPVIGTNPLTASVSNLAATNQVSLTIVVTTSTVPTDTLITNTAQTVADGLTVETSPPVTHVILASALVITKTADPPPGTAVLPGSSITYTVTITNMGSATLTNVSIFDLLDPNTALVFSNTTPPAVVSGPPILVTWPSVAPNNSVVLLMRVNVSSTVAAGTEINNSAIGDSDQTLPQGTGIITHVVATIPVTPSLTITKTAVPGSGSSVGPNTVITYTVTVVNDGTGDASNVLITDTLPVTGVNVITAYLSSGDPVIGTNPLTANVSTLAATNQVTMTIVVTTSTVPTDTLITNTAQVVADGLLVESSLPVTHVITTTVPVLPPSWTFTKSAIPGNGSLVEPGDFITYTITALNTGGLATNVVVSDTLDLANVTLVTSNTTTGTISSLNPVQVTGFDLNNGESVVLTLVVSVTGTVSGTTIDNLASVTSTETLVLPTSSVTHIISNTVIGPPSFSITKSAVPGAGTPVTQNNIITYTIVVVNSGGPATGVVLTDVIPADTAYVSGSLTSTQGTPDDSGGQMTVDVGNFPAGIMTTTFRVRVTTSATTTITNTATVDSNETAPLDSLPVVHPVQETSGPSGGIYLPIIFKNFTGSYATLEWDGAETVCDKVGDLDGGAGLVPDGRTDGVFWLGVNVGSEGPRLVSNIRLTSTQPFVWDTVAGGGPVLGVFSGGSPLNNPDGTVSGVLFNSGYVRVQLWASDDLAGTRFDPNQHTYTVIVNFSDGSSLSAQTNVWGDRPLWCP
ncbi:MAG: DUF11 domain-containing protein [Anaerolineae bacterium]|nr:DUF11 domain-containing protein [Anaerolineae bacterium]